MQFHLEHHIIPDGTSSIVQLTIKAEFTVPTEGGADFAQKVVIEVAKRLSGKDEGYVREQLQGQFWFGDERRPEEPTRP